MVWLQAMDALITLFLLSCGAVELNPIMDTAIQYSPVVFCLLKILAALMSVWLWTQNKFAAWIITIVYILVVIWNTGLAYLLLVG